MTTPGNGKALTPRDHLKHELARYLPSYEKLLPAGYSPDRLVTGALVAATRNPELLKCTPQSVAVALAQIAQWNLDVGTTAHLVPYGTMCTAVADYKGYIEQMVKAGTRKVEAHVVREGDHFDLRRGTEPYIEHIPRAPKGAPIIGAYAIAWFRGGVTQFEYMTLAEIEAIRQAKSQSWKKGDLPAWYARKTVIRQLAKYVPKSADLARLLAEDDLEPGAAPTPEALARLEPAPARGVPVIRTSRDPYTTPEGNQVTSDGEILDEPAPKTEGGKASGDKVMPFGKQKGKRLADIETADLQSTVAWCQKNDAGKFADLIAACESVLRDRSVLVPTPSEELDGEEIPF